MRILALILARGGSKRLPKKNVLLLGGKPLIEWSIRSAQAFPELCDVLVSTDDREIAEVSKNAGALVPWYRPADLANDEATSIDAVLHAIDWYEDTHNKLDGVLLLQPTSPLRSENTIRNGLDLFAKGAKNAVVGVSQATSHPLWVLKIQDGVLKPWLGEGGLNLRSQDLPPAYAVTGSLYLASPQDLRKYKSFYTPSAQPLIIDDWREIVDIDTADDFDLTQLILNMKKNMLS